MGDKLEKVKKKFIKDKLPETESDRLWKELNGKEKELKELKDKFTEQERALKYANKVWRKYIPAFPSAVQSNNAEEILRLIKLEYQNDANVVNDGVEEGQ